MRSARKKRTRVGQRVERVLASHQCALGSIPGPGVICGLSLSFCWFSPCSERFFSGYFGFPFSAKKKKEKRKKSKIQFDPESESQVSQSQDC